MKWFSVKKYSPPVFNVDYFVRNIFGIFVAQLESIGTWIDADGKYFEDDAEPTHFCIPDPIEIEE